MKQILNYLNKKYSFGIDLSKISKINSSTNNTVYDLGDYILKISTNKFNLKNEYDILNKIQGIVYCPNAILYDTFNNKYILLINKIKGETLDYYWNNLDKSVQQGILNQIVYNMGSLHNISNEYFVDYIMGEKIVSTNYYDILKIKLNKIKGKVFNNKDISKDKVNKYIEYFEDNKGVFDNEKPVLIHNDLWYKNILYNNVGKISIIDFETSIFAPKQIELFVIYSHFIYAKNYFDENPQNYVEFDFVRKLILTIKTLYGDLYKYNQNQSKLYYIIKYLIMLSNYDKSWYNYSDIIKFEKIIDCNLKLY